MEQAFDMLQLKHVADVTPCSTDMHVGENVY